MTSPSPRTTARAPELMRLVWIQRGVYAAEHDGRASRARTRADLVAAKRVTGVNPTRAAIEDGFGTISDGPRSTNTPRTEPLPVQRPLRFLSTLG
jgi:hypothetical protein